MGSEVYLHFSIHGAAVTLRQVEEAGTGGDQETDGQLDRGYVGD